MSSHRAHAHGATVRRRAKRFEERGERAQTNEDRTVEVQGLLRRCGAMRLADVADWLDEEPGAVSGAVAMLWRSGQVSISGAGDLSIVEAVPMISLEAAAAKADLGSVSRQDATEPNARRGNTSAAAAR